LFYVIDTGSIRPRARISERIFSALDIRPAGAAFLENAGWNYCVFTKQLVPIFGTCPAAHG
jgi:hypothetical protein